MLSTDMSFEVREDIENSWRVVECGGKYREERRGDRKDRNAC